MKSIFTFFILVSLSATLCRSQNIDYPQNIVNQLASEKFHGRGYTNKGDSIAAQFIKHQFDSLGVKPYVNSYYQPFTLDINTFPNHVSLQINETHLKPGIDFLVNPDAPSINGNFKTVRILKNNLIQGDILQRKIKQASGKFLVIDERNQPQLSSKDQEKTNQIIKALRYDPKLDIAGVLLLTEQKLTWYISSFQVSRPYFIVHCKKSIKSIKTINVQIDAQLKEKYQSQNIIGYIEGKLQPDSFIVLLAHYDHLGNMGKEVYFPGANDNASGVAMLLSLAKYFSKNQPKYSMLFIALGAEEAGLIGAQAFVQDPPIDLNKIRFLINFDLAGTGDDGIKVVNATVFKNEFERLKQLNQEFALMESVQPRGEACNSDHCLFYQKGVPCFYIYTLGGISAYHDVYDRPETLPFTDFDDYLTLMKLFIEGF